jgi:hypothetical protein
VLIAPVSVFWHNRKVRSGSAKMDLTSLAVFAGILMVAAGTPGPNIGALVARVISRGHKGVFSIHVWSLDR